MSRCTVLGVTLAVSLAVSGPASARASTGGDGTISALLDTYQEAVSHKDEAAFEALLLSRDIPFAYVPASPGEQDASALRGYDRFRRSVFVGPPFTQRFRHVTIHQHGALADVRLIFVNSDAHGTYSGWKTMQLIRVTGVWKIASEFYTDLD